jgi:superfamily II DNA/RNA helicase
VHRLPPQGFSLKAVKHLVLDEADKLLDMDFEQEIDQILKVSPQHSDLLLQRLGVPVGHVLE